MTDPILPIVGAALMGMNVMANVTPAVQGVVAGFSTTAKYQHPNILAFDNCGTPEKTHIASDRGPIELQSDQTRARSFETRITFETHCRLLGIPGRVLKKVRHKVVLRLVGSIAPYVVAAPADDSADLSPHVEHGGGIYGFHNVSMTLGVPTGRQKQNPYSKFNESINLTFTPELLAGQPMRLRINWKCTCAGFVVLGGVPMATSKTKNGFFELSVDGELTDGDEISAKNFTIESIDMLDPADDAPAGAGIDASGEQSYEAADRPMVSRSQPPRGRFRKGKAIKHPDVGTST